MNYEEYDLKHSERLIAILSGWGLCFIAAYLLYMNAAVSILLAIPGACLAPPFYKRRQLRKRKEQLTFQFVQLLNTLSSSLAAGLSVENAFRSAARDLRMIYLDPNTFILKELERICIQLELGEPLERPMAAFSKRSGIEEIKDFTEVLMTCKRTGGNVVEVIRKSANLIADKLEIQLDIQVLLAQKKLEANLLSVIPYGLIALLSFGSPDYMAPMHQGIGMVIMTVALVILLLSMWLIRYFMRIEV